MQGRLEQVGEAGAGTGNEGGKGSYVRSVYQKQRTGHAYHDEGEF